MTRHALAMSAMVLAGSVATAAPPDSTNAESAAAGDSVAELKNMVKDLKSQVDDLKAQNNQDWLTERRADEIKGLVQDVLADADTRASLLESGAMAGWDKGFFIMSADGNYKLNIGGQFQFRGVYNRQEGNATNGIDSNRSGFENRRTKLILKGHVVDPSVTFDIQFAANRATGVVGLEDAGWIQKDFGNGWKVRAGQMKAPYLREELLSSTRLMAIERSLVNSIFTAGTVQGIQVLWEGDTVHAAAMFHDGPGSANTPWQIEDTEGAVSARVEWLASGDWKNVADYNSFKDEGSSMIFGGAVDYSVQEFGTGSAAPTFNNAEIENLGLTADATVDFGGVNVSGAIMYRQLNMPGAAASIDQLGVLIRGGVFVTDDLEIYGQYEWADSDIAGLSDLSVVTVGVTKYWAKHQLKWQTDVGIGLDAVMAGAAINGGSMAPWLTAGGLNGAGWRADAAGMNNQITVRTQIQLLF